MRTWLRNARVDHGLTQQDMAKKLGVTLSSYCLVENGKRQQEMYLSTAAKIGQILELPVQQIVDYESKM